MSFVYTNALAKMMSGDIDLNTDDIQAMIVMTGSTAPTEEDAEFISDITTLSEYDGSGYMRVGLTLETVTVDGANDRAIFDAQDVDFGALENGAATAAGVVLFKNVGGNDATSPLLAYMSGTSFPVNPAGAALTIQWNATGIFALTQP